MDLKLYYQKIREVEAKIADAFPIIVSHETADGGKAGTLAQVTKAIAAKMVVDGAARVASAVEAKAFQAAQAEAKRIADQLAAAAKVQLAVLTTDELSRLKGMSQPSKDQA